MHLLLQRPDAFAAQKHPQISQMLILCDLFSDLRRAARMEWIRMDIYHRSVAAIYYMKAYASYTAFNLQILLNAPPYDEITQGLFLGTKFGFFNCTAHRQDDTLRHTFEIWFIYFHSISIHSIEFACKSHHVRIYCHSYFSNKTSQFASFWYGQRQQMRERIPNFRVHRFDSDFPYLWITINALHWQS